MAFADTLLTETDATMIIIDRHPKPGGHWNIAYPFVTLHQPSAFFGVASKELSKGHIEHSGLNKGLNELATGAELIAYYDDVMRNTLLPSGRVQYFPLSEYEVDGRFTSRVSGKTHQATATKKYVDATHLTVSVPFNHTPNFEIDTGVNFIPVNDLPHIQAKPEGYVIIGGGKTGIDAALFLLENGVDPDDITIIMPRDGWMLDRRNTQPTQDFFFDTIGAQAAQMEALATAKNIPDLFVKLEAGGYLLRIDPDVEPQMFHGATVSKLEIEALQSIKNIVRMGRVSHLKTDEIVLADGTIPTSPNTVHVDCSARAITNETIKPIFQDDVITPQFVRSYQPAFSASLIAYIEANYDDDATKNRLCGVLPLPNTLPDFLRFTFASMMNQFQWGQDRDLSRWIKNNRLDGFTHLISSVREDETDKIALLNRFRASAPKAAQNLTHLLAQNPS
jgi:hypothetical protein